MAGPRPMQQPPGYPPQQVVYVQQPQKKGCGKGCIIAAVVVLLVGALATAGIGFAVFKAGEMLAQVVNNEAEGAVKITDEFMAKLSKGDIKGAYELCEQDKIKAEDFENFCNAYREVLKDNTGVTYVKQKVPIFNIDLVGAPYIQNDEAWIQMYPAAIKGKGDATIAFLTHRKSSGAPHKIKWIAINGVKPGADNPGVGMPIGDSEVPMNTYNK